VNIQNSSKLIVLTNNTYRYSNPQRPCHPHYAIAAWALITPTVLFQQSINGSSYAPLHQNDPCCAVLRGEIAALCPTLCLVSSRHLQRHPRHT